MKKLTQKNLDMYIFIKEFVEENGYCPSYREIKEGTNYKSIASVKQAIEKLEEIKMLKTGRDENKNMLARSIKIIDNDYTKEKIKELRESVY